MPRTMTAQRPRAHKVTQVRRLGMLALDDQFHRNFEQLVGEPGSGNLPGIGERRIDGLRYVLYRLKDGRLVGVSAQKDKAIVAELPEAGHIDRRLAYGNRKAVEPKIGDRVEYLGQQGRVAFVTGGAGDSNRRVRFVTKGGVSYERAAKDFRFLRRGN